MNCIMLTVVIDRQPTAINYGIHEKCLPDCYIRILHYTRQNVALKLFHVQIRLLFSTRQHAIARSCALYAIARPSVRPSVGLSVSPSHGWIS